MTDDDSDMECDLHLLTVPGKEKSFLLCLLVDFLQWHHHPLPYVLLRLWTQKGLCQVSFITVSVHFIS